MADNTVSILATLRDQVSGPLGKIVTGFGGLKSSLEGVRQRLSPLTSGFGGLISSLVLLGEARKSIAAAEDAVEAETRLLTALRGRRDLLEQIKAITTDLQGKTVFDGDDLNKVATQLINAGVAVGDLNRFLSLTTNIAAATGTSLTSAARGLALLNQGESAGSLARLVPELRDVLKESEGGAEALALLEERFKGFASAIASTDFGKAKQQINLIGDEEERLGAVLIKVKVAILTGILPAFRALANFLESSFGQEVIATFTSVLGFVLQFAPAILGVIAAAKAFSFITWIGGLISALGPVLLIVGAVVGLVAIFDALGVDFELVGFLAGLLLDVVIDLVKSFFNGAKSAEDLFDVLITRSKQAGNFLLTYIIKPIGAFLEGLLKSILAVGKLAAAGLKLAFFGIVVAVGAVFETLVKAVAFGIDQITNSAADLLFKLPGVSKEVADAIRTNLEAGVPKFTLGEESLQQAADDAKAAGQAFIDAFPNAFAELSGDIDKLSEENNKLEAELDKRQEARAAKKAEEFKRTESEKSKTEIKAKEDTLKQIQLLEEKNRKILEGKDESSLQRRRETRTQELERALSLEQISFEEFIKEREQLELAPIDAIIVKRGEIIAKLVEEKLQLINNKGELQDILAKTQQLGELYAKQAEDADTRKAKDNELRDLRIANDKKVLDAARKSLKELLDDAENARQRFDDRVSNIRERVAQGFLFPAEGAEKEQAALDTLNSSLGRYEDRIETLIEKNPELATELGRVAEEMEILRTQVERTSQSVEDFERGFIAGASNVISAGANLRTAGIELGETFATDVSGAIVDSITEADFSWQQFAVNFLKLIAKMIIQLILFRAIATALGVPVGFNKGGLVQGFAEGGHVPGPRVNRDIVNARLTPHEFVQPVPAVDFYGVEIMEAMRHRLIPRALFKGIGGLSAAANRSGLLNGGGSVSGSVGGGSTLVANEQTLERILRGGKAALLRHIGENSAEYRGVLQR